MTRNSVEVLDPGILTHIQDGGRVGFLSTGVAPAGAQDFFSLRLANQLVGNKPTPPPLGAIDPGSAGLEMTAKGPVLRFSTDSVVAVTGGECLVTVDGARRPHGASFMIDAGSVLEIGVITEGMRAYLAIQGGIQTPPYLGSRSTHLFAGLGGVDGRALEAGATLPLAVTYAPDLTVLGRILTDDAAGYSLARSVIRVIMGPQDHLFTVESVEAFLDQPWTLGELNSRMGFRFAGPKLEFLPRAAYIARAAGSDPSNIVDDIIPIGGIQCPSGVEAIVMGVENPTVGGFAKIATVISADLGKVGQLRAGDSIKFAQVSAEQAAEQLDWLVNGRHVIETGCL